MGLSKTEKVKLKEWAQLLYCKEHRAQTEIAETIGVSKRTINEWKRKYDWDALRNSMLKTKEESLKDIYAQLDEFNKFIKNKPEGLRFPDSKESDALKKITASIRDLETELNVTFVIEVGIELTQYLREFDFMKAKEVADLFDEFIKHKMK